MKRKRRDRGPSKRSGPARGRQSGPASDRPTPRDDASPPGSDDDSHDSGTIGLRPLRDEDGWELVHPRCAREREEDLEEVRHMLDAGETDVARDECRWLLEGCRDCLEAHRILGEIALVDEDLPLARGHFGYAYRLGAAALERAGGKVRLPYARPANRSFFESAKGLVWCLKQLDKPEMAAEVAAQAVACDPEDPLQIAALVADAG
ncbi:MAG: hypothetical protein AB7O59_02505 [Pirellulales bacterium]